MPSAELAAVIERLAGGEEDLPAATLAALSDLSRDDSEALQEAWSGIPVETRRSLVETATTLAEDDPGLDFTSLGLVGLGDESGDVRLAAAAALYESPQRVVASRLLERLTDDSDRDVRAAAAASLHQFVLMRELGQFDAALGDDVVDALRAAFEASGDQVALRAAAIESLGPRSLPWVDELIVAAYNDDDATVRLAAVHAMGDSAEERWLEYLYEQLYADDADFRFGAVVACGAIGSEDAVEPLAALLSDEDEEVVMAVIASLGEIGGDSAIEVLREYRDVASEELAPLVTEAIQTSAEFGGAAGYAESDPDQDDDEE